MCIMQNINKYTERYPKSAHFLVMTDFVFFFFVLEYSKTKMCRVCNSKVSKWEPVYKWGRLFAHSNVAKCVVMKMSQMNRALSALIQLEFIAPFATVRSAMRSERAKCERCYSETF